MKQLAKLNIELMQAAIHDFAQCYICAFKLAIACKLTRWDFCARVLPGPLSYNSTHRQAHGILQCAQRLHGTAI